MNKICLHVLPRQTMTWDCFVKNTPPGSIALDGLVPEAPNTNVLTRHINFNHHEGVVRGATMSTCMQVYTEIKQGLMGTYNLGEQVNVYINDTDQDTAMAVWLLNNYKMFEGHSTNPVINRLLNLVDKLDITAGSWPCSLSDSLTRQYCWIFEPYTSLRKSGHLYEADSRILEDNINATMSRITKHMLSDSDEIDPDTRHEILFNHPEFWVVNEIGGNDARVYLFDKGMKAFISLVSTRSDGNRVFAVGKKKFANFDIVGFLKMCNERDVFKWGGSDTVIGSNRENGSTLQWQDLVEIAKEVNGWT